MDNKILTIVGMGPGVSYSVAQRFAKDGFKIAMIARNKQRLDDYKDEFEKMNFEVQGFPADAEDESSLISTFEKIHETFGKTEVLLYNAFSMRVAKPAELNYEDFIKDFKINVAGALVSSQQVLPSMIEKKEGAILFTGGGTGLEPMPAYSSLGIGKAGIRNLCFSMFKDLKSKCIHVATVTITGFVKPGTKWDPDLIAEEFWKLYQQKPGEFEREIQI
ncbi:MAG: SDR family NAD(P)-dependent oxidoreductase [Ignavibacteria bacterium]